MSNPTEAGGSEADGEAVRVLRNLCANAWKWDLRRFLAEAGLEDGPDARALFVAFQSAAQMLGKLGPRIAAVVAKPAG